MTKITMLLGDGMIQRAATMQTRGGRHGSHRHAIARVHNLDRDRVEIDRRRRQVARQIFVAAAPTKTKREEQERRCEKSQEKRRRTFGKSDTGDAYNGVGAKQRCARERTRKILKLKQKIETKRTAKANMLALQKKSKFAFAQKKGTHNAV
jgi:hypothetical protein